MTDMKPTLLYVEDSVATFRAMRSLLRSQFDVQQVGDLASAMAYLDTRPTPAGIILDLMLDGDGDGLAVLRRVRAEGLPVRVVVTTGIPEGPHMQSVVDQRPDALLKKPYDWEDLDEALAPLLAPSP